MGNTVEFPFGNSVSPTDWIWFVVIMMNVFDFIWIDRSAWDFLAFYSGTELTWFVQICLPLYSSRRLCFVFEWDIVIRSTFDVFCHNWSEEEMDIFWHSKEFRILPTLYVTRNNVDICNCKVVDNHFNVYLFLIIESNLYFATCRQIQVHALNLRSWNVKRRLFPTKTRQKKFDWESGRLLKFDIWLSGFHRKWLLQQN